VNVTFLSEPRVLQATVKSVMMQYNCLSNEDDVIATKELSLNLQ
jgi:hypothetical protein